MKPVVLIVVGLALCATGCQPPGQAVKPAPSATAAPASPVIDEEAAREKAIERYNELFGRKFYYNSAAEMHHQFPMLTSQYFHKAELKDGCWILDADPLVGLGVHARVSADGTWVELTSVEFATE